MTEYLNYIILMVPPPGVNLSSLKVYLVASYCRDRFIVIGTLNVATNGYRLGIDEGSDIYAYGDFFMEIK